MQKIILYVAIMLCATWTKAQIQNPSFEQTDSLGKSSYWAVAQGKMTKLSVVQLGIIPFTASEGNFFVLVESDTQTVNVKPGIVQQQFLVTDTPGSFSFNYLYIPQFIGQHATVKLYMSKWNGLSRDTVLYITDTIPVVANGNTIPIQWNTFAITLNGKYRTNTLPDSAWIELQNDDAPTPSKDVRLYVDNIQFGKWAVGIAELTHEVMSYYPNPANEILVLTGVNTAQPYSIQLRALDGKQYTFPTSTEEDKLLLHTQHIPTGLYLLSIKTPTNVLNKRILICHD